MARTQAILKNFHDQTSQIEKELPTDVTKHTQVHRERFTYHFNHFINDIKQNKKLDELFWDAGALADKAEDYRTMLSREIKRYNEAKKTTSLPLITASNTPCATTSAVNTAPASDDQRASTPDFAAFLDEIDNHGTMFIPNSISWNTATATTVIRPTPMRAAQQPKNLREWLNRFRTSKIEDMQLSTLSKLLYEEITDTDILPVFELLIDEVKGSTGVDRDTATQNLLDQIKQYLPQQPSAARTITSDNENQRRTAFTSLTVDIEEFKDLPLNCVAPKNSPTLFTKSPEDKLAAVERYFSDTLTLKPDHIKTLVQTSNRMENMVIDPSAVKEEIKQLQQLAATIQECAEKNKNYVEHVRAFFALMKLISDEA